MPKGKIAGSPSIGGLVELRLSDALASTDALLIFGESVASIDLGPMGAPGCFNLVNETTHYSLATNGSGAGTFTLTLPDDPGLAGRFFCAQFAVHDPTANALGWVTSNGMTFICLP